MKYLKRFATLTEYTNYLSSPEYISPNISFVDDNDGEGHSHTYINKQTFRFGDLLLYYPSRNFSVAVNYQEYISNYNTIYSKFIPQALCVISTNIGEELGDGFARFISLKSVDRTSSEVTKFWNRNQYYIAIDKLTAAQNYTASGHSLDTNLINKNNIRPLIDPTNVTSTTNVNGSTWACTPIDRKQDWGTNYTSSNPNLVYNYNSSWQYTKPLYLEDWSLNPEMFRDNLNLNEYLTDRNGYTNTLYLISITETTFTFNGQYQAAEACHSYYTEGISSGKWYLPSITELSLGLCRYDTINNILNSLKSIGISCANLVSNNYWSSTEYNSGNAAIFSTDNGGIDGSHGYYKCYNYYVRPFFRF